MTAMKRLARSCVLVAVAASASVALAHPGVGVAPLPPATTPAPPAAPAVPVLSWRDEVRAELAAEKLDGWLLWDFHGQNALAAEVVKPRGALRRWFYLIPQTGEPQLVVHKLDVAAFDVPKPLTYTDWHELEAQLKVLLKGKKRVAMEYSPRGGLPALSRVDGGTVELVRASGAQVTSSGNFITLLRGRVSDAQLKSHQAAASALAAVKDEAFAFIGQRLSAGRKVTEYDVQQLVLKSFIDRVLEATDLPMVAAGVNTGDPRYQPSATHSSEIQRGDVVLLTLAARLRGNSDAVYAEQTWVGFVGEAVPENASHLFAVARDARERVIALIKERRSKKLPLRAFELDDAARAVATKAALGDRYLQRTGHSLGVQRFGEGPYLDNLETHDDRLLLPQVAFTVEPGLYVPGQLGVRTGVDVLLAGPDGLVVTPEKLQQEIELIAAAPVAPPAPVPAKK
jgi:Xaa-Pro aminopeptidase